MNKDNTHFLDDCSNNFITIGTPVYYINTKGEVCTGTVTRYRIEIDGKILRSSNKIRRSFERLDKVREEIENG